MDGWIFFPLNNLVISSFRSNCKSVYIVFFPFPFSNNTKQTRCAWFTSGGGGKGRVLLAPARNVLRGEGGGLRSGLFILLISLDPKGPILVLPGRSPDWGCQPGKSIISSGYGPFQVSPQLSPSISLSSGEAVLSPTWHRVAVSQPSPAWAPQGPHHPTATGLTLSPQAFLPSHQPCEKSLGWDLGPGFPPSGVTHWQLLPFRVFLLFWLLREARYLITAPWKN